MREILFRGKRIDNGGEIEGSCVRLDFAAGSKYYIHTGKEFIEVVKETIRQYIGLTDKSGKNIFERDIVKDLWNKVGIVEYSTEDVWSCCCCNDKFDGAGFIARSKYGLMELSECEVIGNIHDNPELLEKQII